MKALPDGEPTREAIAAQACASVRAACSASCRTKARHFHEVLDDIRRDLAERYLGNERIRLADAACLLGFSDQSSFTRAVNRWFDAAPSKVRAGLLERTG